MQYSVVKINGVVQHYTWGGTEYIPQLTGMDNSEQKPFAEYWLGAHPNHPSTVAEDNSSLLQFIKSNPEVLGSYVRQQFGSLPFLLKVLDVQQMLSIQVHPSKRDASIGYDTEEAKGIQVNAPNRNYKDRNHKPELMVALSEFWLLHGFKPEQLLKATFLKVPELLPLLSLFEDGGYQRLYEHVMMLPQATVDQMLQPLVERIVPLYNSGTLQKSSEDFWAARAALVYKEEGHIDRGIFSIYFFNLLHLKKGEGIYQPARLPHAYLEGQNVEIMANSDNVLRAGLTDKYIDVPELLKHVDFVPTYPNIMSAEQTGISVFSTPAEEFELTLYSFIKECAWLTEGPEVLLLLEGTAKLEIESEIVSLKRGEALFVSAGKNVVLQGGENTQMYRAAVPVHKK